MKTLILKSVVAAALALVLLAPLSQAQTVPMRFSVPFAFTMGDRHLPAGDYTVRWDSVTGTIALERGSVETLLLPYGIAATPSPASATANGKLLFHQYGDRYFLHGVERTGGIAKREWAPSKSEKETAKAGAPRELALLVR